MTPTYLEKMRGEEPLYTSPYNDDREIENVDREIKEEIEKVERYNEDRGY